MITGIISLNEAETEGGTFPPMFIFRCFILERRINTSVATNPIMIPANIPVVPKLEKSNAPEISTAFFAPTGTRLIVKGITIIKLESAITAANKALLNPLFFANVYPIGLFEKSLYQDKRKLAKKRQFQPLGRCRPEPRPS